MTGSGNTLSLIIGITGGSGSGKTELANYLCKALGRRAMLLSHDWYYKDRTGCADEARSKLNFDHPRALETALLTRHLRELSARKEVRAPRYNYATSSRTESVAARSADIIFLEGLFILHEERLRCLIDTSIFVEVPADIRLLRRIRRDTRERGIPVEETLRLYENFTRPMHDRFVQPSARHATHVWEPLKDKTFPARFKRQLKERLG